MWLDKVVKLVEVDRVSGEYPLVMEERDKEMDCRGATDCEEPFVVGG